ncbi:hypothetical protein SLNWT_5021 [Streptomyces albus]|uniref:Uncharacterized protein n=1 Tax=Streptomyces albus (strain ATCC 21838 / DSM 41398 / FERM P-419 / JCM 4703 / NBRC 107858) TaxID=1081613 RepID=A0A0B5F4W7_STRA4|nr:hypothetical protein SLNWT_5021 [Streptomyces albus]AOU79701.1 hypothetical protein SLNHY_5010 [Streptomyces albus]AYN35423.1 hypothetical protein DUI70_4927 [Streptomyces albus]
MDPEFPRGAPRSVPLSCPALPGVNKKTSAPLPDTHSPDPSLPP